MGISWQGEVAYYHQLLAIEPAEGKVIYVKEYDALYMWDARISEWKFIMSKIYGLQKSDL